MGSPAFEVYSRSLLRSLIYRSFYFQTTAKKLCARRSTWPKTGLADVMSARPHRRRRKPPLSFRRSGNALSTSPEYCAQSRPAQVFASIRWWRDPLPIMEGVARFDTALTAPAGPFWGPRNRISTLANSLSALTTRSHMLPLLW